MKTIVFWILGLLFCLLGVHFFWPISIPVQQQWSFYDLNGDLLYTENPYQNEDHWAKNNHLLTFLQAIEDQNFFHHGGVDVKALARAGWQNFQSEKIVSGGSTLTMQLAGMLFLAEEPHDMWYKIRQIWYALKLEQKTSKDEILRLYAQTVYLGQGAYGFESGAKRYFSKTIDRLDIGEIALLIGIIPRPDGWNPIDDLAKAEQRKNFVLSQLKHRGLISPETYNRFSQKSIVLEVANQNKIHAPHFVFWVQNQLRDKIAPDIREVHVFTTLDKEKYEQTLAIVRENIEQNEQTKHISNASIVGISLPQNRLELLLGSRDFFEKSISGQVNMATASREMGSTLKPFLFSLALEMGFSPLEVLHDERQSFVTENGSYSPRNFDPHTEYGLVRFREALTNSYNISAVELLSRIGVGRFSDFLTSFGFLINNAQESGLSLVLGTGESSLLDLTKAYAVFPQKGTRLPLQFFETIKNEKNEVVLTWKDFVSTPSPKIIKTDTAEWIVNALSDQSARWKNFSRGNPLELEFETASKTGTSQDFRDNYVVGFSSDWVVGTWVGNTDGTPMITSSGIEGAGRIWQSVMRVVHEKKPSDFTYTGDRQTQSVCRWAWQSYPDCAEKYQAFVLDADRETHKTPQTPKKDPELDIAFPGDGDILHPNSSLLIQVRHAPSEDVSYFVDGRPTSNIIDSFTPGRHTIRVEYKNQSDEIEIFVEDAPEEEL